jgi:hypothetical protein
MFRLTGLVPKRKCAALEKNLSAAVTWPAIRLHRLGDDHPVGEIQNNACGTWPVREPISPRPRNPPALKVAIATRNKG